MPLSCFGAAALDHRLEGLDHPAVVGAGGALDRQQRGPRRMEHGVVGAVDDALETIIRRPMRQLGKPLGFAQGDARVLQDRPLDHWDVRRSVDDMSMIANVAGQLVRREPGLLRARHRLDFGSECMLH